MFFQVGGLPPVKAACVEGDFSIGLTALQKRGLTCITGVGDKKCLKQSVCVALYFGEERDRLIKVRRKRCHVCGRGKQKERDPSSECRRTAESKLNQTRMLAATWEKYMDDIKDSGVNYPADQEDLERMELNYKSENIAFHVYDRRGREITISQKLSLKMSSLYINLIILMFRRFYP